MTERLGSGRGTLVGRGVALPVPIALEPAAYAGALIYGTDGRLYQSNGTAWVLNIGRQLYSATAPNAAVPVLQVEPDAAQNASTNIDIAIMPRGTGAILARVPDNTSVGGNKRGANAVDLQTVRFAASQVASGDWATISGGTDNKATGVWDTIGGGEDNDSNGNWSVISGGESNIASSSHSVIGGGRGNIASNQRATVAGGQINYAQGADSTIAGGTNNIASGASSTVGGGGGNIASGANSVVPGGWNATTRGLNGRMSFATGLFSSMGDAQYGLHVLRRSTTDATVTGLGAGGTAPSSTNIPILPDNSLYAFHIRVSCIQTGGTAGAAGDCKAWDIVGAIKRGANAAATALLGTPTITVLGANTNLGTTNSAGAIITIAADTTLGGLLVNVTGQANKNLRWVATVETTEVAY
jgi:hypothetical protein